MGRCGNGKVGGEMKRGIEVWSDYDRAGRWCLRIKKAKGKLTLDEITQAAKECEYDFYLLLIDAFHEETEQFGEEPKTGDFVTLYRTDLFYEEGEY